MAGDVGEEIMGFAPPVKKSASVRGAPLGWGFGGPRNDIWTKPSVFEQPSAFASVVRRRCGCEGEPAGKTCSSCGSGERKVQRRSTGTASAPPAVEAVLRSGGAPLDTGTRGAFEPSLGVDLGDVRVHADERAAASARAIDATAYTVGRHVVLDPSAMGAPGSARARETLAHELAHVVQQGGGDPSGSLRIGAADDPLEHQADVMAARALRSAPTTREGAAEAPGPVAPLVQQQPRGTGAAHPHTPTFFNCRTPTDHKHKPTHDWLARQKGWARQCDALKNRAENELKHGRIAGLERPAIECACANLDPAGALEAARRATMFPGGLASQHIDHYLTGKGADYHEDLHNFLLKDDGVRRKLAAAIKHAPRGCVSIEQSDYSSHDFLFAFGGIDRMDYEVLGNGNVHVWFRDRYEWHPEDTGRPSNCVHRAAVELKDSGAADYWMVGDTEVPRSWFGSGPTLWERLFG